MPGHRPFSDMNPVAADAATVDAASIRSAGLLDVRWRDHSLQIDVDARQAVYEVLSDLCAALAEVPYPQELMSELLAIGSTSVTIRQMRAGILTASETDGPVELHEDDRQTMLADLLEQIDADDPVVATVRIQGPLAAYAATQIASVIPPEVFDARNRIVSVRGAHA
jgi:hypothetical protein